MKNKRKRKDSTKICNVCLGTGVILNDSWGSGFIVPDQCDVCLGEGRPKTVIGLSKVKVPFT